MRPAGQVPGNWNHSPEAMMRGPMMAPAAVCWAMLMLMPKRAPTSRAEVTPDISARRQLATAFRVNSSWVSPRRRSMLSIPPSPVKCSWQSIMPGTRVSPWPLIFSWWTVLRGRAVSSPIQLMRPPATSTLTWAKGSAPVPSMSLTLRTTTSMGSLLKRISIRGLVQQFQPVSQYT